MRTILEICNAAVHDTAFAEVTTVYGGSGGYAKQLAELVTTTGLDLAKRFDWQELTVEGTFTTAATALQVNLTSSFPYLRKIIDRTMFNRTQNKRIVGGITPQAWQALASNGMAPADLYFRIRGGGIYFPGTPVAGESVYFEYMDRRVYTDAGGTPKERATADTDLPRLPDELFVLGVRWRLLQKKGVEYGEVFREYEDMIENLSGNNAPQENLSLNPYHGRACELSDGYIPDGNWPSS